MQDKSYITLNPNSDNCLVLTCEHASNNIPPQYENLDLPATELNRHIAYDKGVAKITQKLAERLNCFAILGKYSRLLIDLNRDIKESELILSQSDTTPIPANENLSVIEINKRIQTYYTPYYDALNNHIEKLKTQGKNPIIFSIHSFTPQLKGKPYRPWQAGILYHKPQKLATYLYDNLQKITPKIIGSNVPYDLREYNTGAVVFCGENKGHDYALIEIRDDEFNNLEEGSNYWADKLATLLEQYLKDLHK